MAVDENTSSSIGNLQDNLETITGIGPRVAEALSHIGIHRLDDLAESTPSELAKALVGLRISPKRIEAENWIGQAQGLLQKARDEQASLQQSQEAEQEPAETPIVDNTPQGTQWHQHAGFSLFFDYALDGAGEQFWQTRVYHDETGADAQFPGVNSRPWINWILQEAGLPGAAGADLVEPTTTAPAAMSPQSADQIAILDVQVEPGSSDVSRGKLVSTIYFTVSGADTKTLAADNLPCQIIVHTVDLGNGVTKLVASEPFQPEQPAYRYRLEFPIPDLGRHELQTIVLIQSQTDLMAIYRGPIIKVVP